MDEYIEREAALDICQKEYEERLRMFDYCGDTAAWNIGEAIKFLPAADVAPVVHGRWVLTPKKGFVDSLRRPVINIVCSSCGFLWCERSDIKYFKHCPNCGAKMDGGEEDAAG